MKILHIDSSTNGEASISRALSAAIVAHLTEQNPEAEVTYRDFEKEPLAHIDAVTTGAIRKPPEAHNAAEAAAYGAERAVLDEFLDHDVVVLGAPMYNFTVPSTIKAWVDRLGVARVTFRYGENGPEGMVKGKRMIVASARGGRYAEKGIAEHQEAWLNGFFAFIGVTDFTVVRAEGTSSGTPAEHVEAARDQIEAL